MVGAENLNGTCWCTTPCLCPTLLFLMTDGSLPHGKVWVECIDNFRGLIDKQKDGKGRKKLKKLLLQHDLMSRQLVHARVVHLESSVLFLQEDLKNIHTNVYIYIGTNIVQWRSSPTTRSIEKDGLGCKLLGGLRWILTTWQHWSVFCASASLA